VGVKRCNIFFARVWLFQFNLDWSNEEKKMDSGIQGSGSKEKQ
jgi:hypothetical protein